MNMIRGYTLIKLGLSWNYEQSHLAFMTSYIGFSVKNLTELMDLL